MKSISHDLRHLAWVCAALLAVALPKAQAQGSSVTVYGRVDLSVTRQNNGTSPINASNGQLGAAGKRWDVRPGSAGRIGFRGTEDLGGGLSASFLLEHRFSSDTGEALTPFWQRGAYVELGKAGLGSVYAGREYFPVFWVALRLDPWGFDSAGTPGTKHQLANYVVDGGIRTNNTVGVRSASFGGFTTNLAVAAGEGVRPRSTGGNVEYREGAVYAGVGWDRLDSRNNVMVVGGSYNFGLIKPMLTYVDSTVLGVAYKNITLAASVPLPSAILKVAVARLDPAGPNNKNTRVGLGYEYLLSKRTSLMANLGSAQQQGTAAGRALTRTTIYETGLKHNF
jgi:predicted porin